MKYSKGQEIVICVIYDDEAYDPKTRVVNVEKCKKVLERIIKGERLEGLICVGKIERIDHVEEREPSIIYVHVTKVYYNCKSQYDRVQGFHEVWAKLGKYVEDKYSDSLGISLNPSQRRIHFE